MTPAERASLVEHALLIANDAPTPNPTTIGRVARLLARQPLLDATTAAKTIRGGGGVAGISNPSAK